VRTAIVTLALGAALVAAPLASASFLPPGGTWKVVHIAPAVGVKPLKLVRSCNVQSKKRSAIARVSRRTHPVACEQPPRSNALDGAFVITFGP
jgi:hypothetical protein